MRPAYNTDGLIVLDRSRTADFLTLTKPELTFLSVLTAMGGAYLAGLESSGTTTLEFLHVFVGTLLVGGGAGALNQYIERHYDALMKRTENRPLPAGRLLPNEVLGFGLLLSAAGVVYLAIAANPLTGGLALATLVSYLFLYTPLKRISWVSTIVGGVPGGIPPLIGWTAVRNEVSGEAWALFAILFFWQMPHFFSLAWMYRKDYERAGFPMLPVIDRDGSKTAAQILMHLVGLLGASLVLSAVSNLGWVYLVGSLVLGVAFLLCGIDFLRSQSRPAAARRLFFASLAYLPVLLAIVVCDRL
jgi:protoheme IX farnesyltransferase